MIWTHPDFRVSAMSADGTAFGIVQAHLTGATTGYLMELRGIPFRATLKPGALIVSSGWGGVWPRGIPVGTVLAGNQDERRLGTNVSVAAGGQSVRCRCSDDPSPRATGEGIRRSLESVAAGGCRCSAHRRRGRLRGEERGAGRGGRSPSGARQYALAPTAVAPLGADSVRAVAPRPVPVRRPPPDTTPRDTAPREPIRRRLRSTAARLDSAPTGSNAMNLGGAIRALISFLIFVVLHYTLRPLLGWRAPMDFLILALLLAAIRVRPATAAVIGFALGLVSDSLTPDALGAGAIAMTVVGFVASWLKAVFFADNLALNAFFFFLGKWVFDVIYFIVEQRVHGVELVQQLLLWSPLSAAATAAAGVLLLFIMRPLLEPASA